MAALQHLPPRQRAVLILRDVLCWRADEVAQLLDTTVASVTSALQRGRSTLGARTIEPAEPFRPMDEAQRQLLARYCDAFERYDVETLVSLLHSDATMSMPLFAQYRPLGRDGGYEPFALVVLEVAGGLIAGTATYLDAEWLFPLFGLAATFDGATPRALVPSPPAGPSPCAEPAAWSIARPGWTAWPSQPKDGQRRHHGRVTTGRGPNDRPVVGVRAPPDANGGRADRQNPGACVRPAQPPEGQQPRRQPAPAARQLPTSLPGLTLQELTAADAHAYYAVVDRNRAYLSRFGDYQDEQHATLAWVIAHLAQPAAHRFGIRLGQQLIGRADLVPVTPPRYALGYWLSQEFTGHGYTTLACAALIEHGRTRHGATDVYAGVTHGNHRSVAVLRRLGFQPVTRFATYTRFHLSLGPPRRPSPGREVPPSRVR